MKVYDQARTGAVLRARTLRRDSTDAEKLLWRALRTQLPGTKFRRQMPIGPYFADFACFGAKLIVELDGGQHAEATEQDAARTRFIEAQGYRVMRFWNSDVMSNLDGVVQSIADALPPSPSHDASRRGALPLPVGEGNMESI